MSECNRVKSKSVKALLTFFASLVFLDIAVAGEILHLQSGDVTLAELKNKSNFSLRAIDTNSSKLINSQYFILQFQNAITQQDENALREEGLEILRYVPDDAYLVRGVEGQILVLQNKMQNLKGYVPYQPSIRLSPDLKVRSVFNRDALQTVSVQLFAGVDAEQVAEELSAQGILVSTVSGSNIEARAQTTLLDNISAHEGVEWVSKKSQMQLRNFVFQDDNLLTSAAQPLDISNLNGYETGTKIMGFDKAWRAGFKGKGQIVAIADTGLDTGNKATLARDFSNLKASYALGMSSTSWADYMGHGTHVAGSVAGNGSQSNKIVTGGALEAQIVAESLWSQKANNLTTPNNLGVIFQQAYNSGARIHTNSWGDPEAQGIYNTETMQVDQFVWDHPEMLILFASGNDGVDANRDGRIDSGAVSAPSTAKNIISVGASENLVLRGGVQRKLGEIGLTPNEKPWAAEPIASDTLSNNPKGIAAFSSRGPTQDGRIKPDLVAPGSNILSNCSKMEGAEELWGRFDENYCWSGGTSMSTPLVAGAAALVRERLMKIQGADTPSAALVKAVLLQTAVDLYPGQFGEVGKVNGQELLKPGPNFDQGYGRVDVGSAISEKLSLVDNKEGLGTGESKFYKPSGAIRKVTLVYNDAPASPIARKVLVNNLDLEVQVGGRTYTSKSLVDNNEQVTLPEGINTQNATIYVRGVSVPMGKSGKQPYALVF